MANLDPKKVKLIVTNEKQPKISIKPGMRLEVIAIELADTELKKAKGIAARLCGGTSTCLALVEVGPDEPAK